MEITLISKYMVTLESCLCRTILQPWHDSVLNSHLSTFNVLILLPQLLVMILAGCSLLIGFIKYKAPDLGLFLSITGERISSCSRETSGVSRNHIPSWQAIEVFASSDRYDGISIQREEPKGWRSPWGWTNYQRHELARLRSDRDRHCCFWQCKQRRCGVPHGTTYLAEQPIWYWCKPFEITNQFKSSKTQVYPVKLFIFLFYPNAGETITRV